MKNIFLLSILTVTLQNYSMQIEGAGAMQAEQQLDDNCAICLEPLGSDLNNLRNAFECRQHYIHRGCFQPNIETCPLCRRSFDVERTYSGFKGKNIAQAFGGLLQWQADRAEGAQHYAKHMRLINAVRSNNFGRVRQLLREGGIKINVMDHLGDTPLTHAAIQGNIEIATLLIQHGADLNATDIFNHTILMTAASYGEDSIVQLLLNVGVNPNTGDDLGYTPLMEAAEQGHFNIARRLITAGANVNAKNAHGKRAISFAAKHGHADIVYALRNAGSKFKLRDRFRTLTRGY